jgi:hypothetical protein
MIPHINYVMVSYLYTLKLIKFLVLLKKDMLKGVIVIFLEKF